MKVLAQNGLGDHSSGMLFWQHSFKCKEWYEI